VFCQFVEIPEVSVVAISVSDVLIVLRFGRDQSSKVRIIPLNNFILVLDDSINKSLMITH